MSKIVPIILCLFFGFIAASATIASFILFVRSRSAAHFLLSVTGVAMVALVIRAIAVIARSNQ